MQDTPKAERAVKLTDDASLLIISDALIIHGAYGQCIQISMNAAQRLYGVMRLLDNEGFLEEPSESEQLQLGL